MIQDLVLPNLTASSCCWVPVEDPSGNNPPWCFYPAGEGGGPEVCEAINYVGDGPGFAQADFDNMKERFVIHVQSWPKSLF